MGNTRLILFFKEPFHEGFHLPLSMPRVGIMRIWLACFLVLFAIAELFDWLQQFTFPLPIYILGGAFLAIASNYDRIVGLYFQQANDSTPLNLSQQNQVSQVSGFHAGSISSATEETATEDNQ
jgi:hypothetical protein